MSHDSLLDQELMLWHNNTLDTLTINSGAPTTPSLSEVSATILVTNNKLMNLNIFLEN